MAIDELMDVIDGLDALDAASDLAEAGLDVGELATSVDLSEFDPQFAQDITSFQDLHDALETINDAHPGLGNHIQDELILENLEVPKLTALLPWGEQWEFTVPTEENASVWAAALTEGVPESLVNDLHVATGPQQMDGILGTYSIGPDGDAYIHANAGDPNIWETFNHELGHHIFERNPGLKSELLPLLGEEGFLEAQADFLNLYSPAAVPGEACAEALGKFRANPGAFAASYPRCAELLGRILDDVA